MTIIIDDFNRDPNIDRRQLETQIKLCHNAGYYLLNLVDPEGYAKVGILALESPNTGFAYERLPLHGVNVGRGCLDSYDGLISILKQGFKSLFDGDLNAAVQREDTFSSLTKLASGERETLWGDRSKRLETAGDRYFLEFRRFSTTYNWKNRKPSYIDDWKHISIDTVDTSDIHVNVILGVADQTEVQKRISKYQHLFEKQDVSSKFFIPK